MKAVRTAVMVVGAVALVATGVGAVMGAAAFATTFGVSMATVSAISTVATVISTGLSMAAKKPKSTIFGSPTDYRLDPQAGIPYIMGRTFFAGNCIKRETWGVDNQYQGFTTVYSLGPIQSIEKFTMDRTTINFDGAGAATGSLAGWTWLKTQLGLLPEPAALASPVAGYPGWGATSKLSGLAASNWVLKFDKKEGKKFAGGVPAPGIVALGVKVYDPRLDSTYPGGSGPCRANNEATYVYSERPALHGLTWALGRFQNGKRRMGIGMPVSSIDVASFAAAANVEDANDWKVGGVISSADDKWNRLKQIGQAGGWQPIALGGKLSCLQSTPRVSVATIGSDQLAGRASAVGTQSWRDRINGAIPRFRSEDHGWQMIPAEAVRVASYVAVDGEDRTEEFDFELVQQAKQATQLAAYEIVNSREIGPIELTLKIRWVGLKPGDCVTLNIPELNLNNQKALVFSRQLDPMTCNVTLRLQSETDSKHAFALGLVGAVPPIPSLTDSLMDRTVAAPVGWTLTSGALASAGGTVPSLRFTGTVANTNAEAVAFEYRKVGTADWNDAGLHNPLTTRLDVSSVEPGANYEGRVRYIVRGVVGDALTVGPVVVQAISASTATIANTIVGQGALATVDAADFNTQVGGSGKPDLWATSSDNMIANAQMATDPSNWTMNAWTRRDGTVADPSRGVMRVTNAPASAFANSGTIRPVAGGQRLFLDFFFQASTAGLTGTVFVYFYTATQTFISQHNGSFVAGVAWQHHFSTVVAPANAAYFLIQVTGNPGAGQWVEVATPRLAPTENSADVTSMIDGPKKIIVRCDHTGVPLAGQLPAYQTYKLYKNGSQVTSGVTWSLQVTAGKFNNLAAGPTWYGLGSVTENGAAAQVVDTLQISGTRYMMRAEYIGGVRFFEAEIIKETAPPPTSGGSGGGTGGSQDSDVISAALTNTTPAVVSGELIVTVGSLGQVSLSAFADIQVAAAANAGTFDVTLRMQWWNGAAWVDDGAASDSATPGTGALVIYEPPYMQTPGQVSLSYTKTGLTVGSTQKFRVTAFRSSGVPVKTVNISGTASAQG